MLLSVTRGHPLYGTVNYLRPGLELHLSVIYRIAFGEDVLQRVQFLCAYYCAWKSAYALCKRHTRHPGVLAL